MMFETWLSNVATTLGTTTVTAGYIMGLITTLAISMIALIAAGGKNIFGPLIMSYMCVALFTVFGWFNYWLLLVLILLTAGLYADKIKGWLGGED